MGKFAISTRSNGTFQFSLLANNGEVILTSEGYFSKPACMLGISSVQTNSQDDTKYDRKTSSNGKYYFFLKASNGQVIGTSQLYETHSGRENGITSVKLNAPDAVIADQTIVQA